MLTKIELLPCPFCGGKACIVECKHGLYKVGCDGECYATFRHSSYYATEESAAEDWNDRASGLIPCSERMPEKDGNYLCYTEDGDFLQAYYDSGIDDDFQFGVWEQHFDPCSLGWAGEEWVAYDSITHWMPLPQNPKSE